MYRSEKNWFYLGLFLNNQRQEYHDLWQKLTDHLESSIDKSEKKLIEKERTEVYMKISETSVGVVQCFSKSLINGCQRLYQTLPRLLTLWLDYSSNSAYDNEGYVFYIIYQY